MSQKQYKIIAGMPAYNEGKYIGTLVLNTRQYVDEVIVIDDGSTDDTAKIAGLAGATVVSHPWNKGYGAAILSIFAEARGRDPDILIILDADSQHDPREIPRIIQPILDGDDVVIGTRDKQGAKIPLYRRFGQKVISRSVNILSKNPLTDSECGFRAFSRKAIASLNLQENGMAISAETVAEAFHLNLKITQIPVSVTYGKDSSTLNPVSHGLGVFHPGAGDDFRKKAPLFLRTGRGNNDTGRANGRCRHHQVLFPERRGIHSLVADSGIPRYSGSYQHFQRADALRDVEYHSPCFYQG
jgi:glycosyltransferase involved in cell wall biosynthesis